MGTTFYNFHVRTTDANLVKQALEETQSIAWISTESHNGWISTESHNGWISTESHNGWISVYPYRAEAKAIAEFLKIPVLYLSLYDDDIAQYCLYENGVLVDEFDSAPDYWVGQPDEHGDDIEPVSAEGRQRLSGQPEKLLPYCLPETTLLATQSTLNKTNREMYDTLSETTGVPFDEQQFGEKLKISHEAIQTHLAKYSQISPYSQAFPEGFTPTQTSASELAQSVLSTLDAFSIIEGLAKLLGLSERLQYCSGYETPLFEEAFPLEFIGEKFLSKDDATHLLERSIPDCRVIPHIVRQPENKLEAKLKSMRLWLSLGANPNGQDKMGYGMPPLFYAINGRSIEAVQMLLDAGADVNFAVSHSTVRTVFQIVALLTLDCI
jgi:hypothetical protein